MTAAAPITTPWNSIRAPIFCEAVISALTQIPLTPLLLVSGGDSEKAACTDPITAGYTYRHGVFFTSGDI